MSKNNPPVQTGTKICKKCNIEQPVTEFYKHKTMADGRLNKCRSCTKQENNAWRNLPENRKRWNAQRHKKGVMKAHGISSEKFDELQNIQRCPGCKRTRENVGRSFAVDHCHNTGRVRGALCYECNLILGNAHDSATTLRNLAKYLDNNPS